METVKLASILFLWIIASKQLAKRVVKFETKVNSVAGYFHSILVADIR